MAELRPLEAPVTAIDDLPLRRPGRPFGRDGILKTLLAALQQNQKAALHGPAGIGKTTIAATIASVYAQQANQSVLWLNSHDPPLAELAVRIGRAYGVHEVTASPNPLDSLDVLAGLLHQHRPLIVFDGEIQAAALLRFIESCAADIPVLVATGARLPVEGWQSRPIGRLADADAVMLFKQKAGIQGGQFDTIVYSIAERVNFEAYPLVLAARSMIISRQSPHDFNETLHELLDSLDNSGTAAALTASYRSLNQRLRELLLVVGGTLRGEGSVGFLSRAADVSAAHFDQAMTILSRLFLVDRFQRYGESYYRLHPLAHDFLKSRSPGADLLPDESKDDIRGYLAACLGMPDAKMRLAVEMDNFIAAAGWAAERGDVDLAAALVEALAQRRDFVEAEGYSYEFAFLQAMRAGEMAAFLAAGDDEAEGDALEAAAGVEDAELEAVDLEGEAIEEAVLDDILPVLMDDVGLEDMTIDQLEGALDLARQQADGGRQLEILQAMGRLQIVQGSGDEAVATYGEILTIYEDDEDRPGMLETLDMLAGLLIRSEAVVTAFGHIQRGLQLAEELGDYETEMHLQTTRGDAHQELDESVSAVEAYERALSIARERDDKQNEALILHKLGLAHLADGEAGRAIQVLEQANDLFKQQMKRAMEGRVLRELGSAHAALERWSEAVNFHTSALHIARELDDQEQETQQLRQLGRLLIEANRLPEALTRCRQALHVAYQTEEAAAIAAVIVELVTLMMRDARLVLIAELLIADAMSYAADHRDVLRLRDEIALAKEQAEDDNITLAEVAGSARDYAANAYPLS